MLGLAPLYIPEPLLPAPHYAAVEVWTPEDVEQHARLVAHLNDLDEEAFVAVIKCESSFKKDAVGDGGNSYGVTQIHLPSWPDITEEQATDPRWAIQWMATKWQEGKQSLWSCWRITQNRPTV